eukprot:GDKI01024158.1.p1 GENE.GDKI01024158.1~~GDKI01024158.1.p1  ORF type:complete len:511 (-),score=100.12 GDKI01024158.1:166-1698(-)
MPPLTAEQVAALPLNQMLDKLNDLGPSAPAFAARVLELCEQRKKKQEELLRDVQEVKRQTQIAVFVCVSLLDGTKRKVPCTVTRERDITQVFSTVQQILQLPAGDFLVLNKQGEEGRHLNEGGCVEDVLRERDGRKFVEFVQESPTFPPVELLVLTGTTSRTLFVTISKKMTVSEVKAVCIEASGIPASDIRVFVDNRELLQDAGEELQYNALWKPSLQVVSRSEVQGFPLLVKTLKGPPTLMGVSPTATLSDFREKILRMAAVSGDDVRGVHASQVGMGHVTSQEGFESKFKLKGGAQLTWPFEVYIPKGLQIGAKQLQVTGTMMINIDASSKVRVETWKGMTVSDLQQTLALQHHELLRLKLQNPRCVRLLDPGQKRMLQAHELVSDILRQITFLDGAEGAWGLDVTWEGQIFLKGLTNKSHTFDVKATDSIEQIKVMVQQKTGDSVSSQRLIYAGQQLQDGCTLSKYNMTPLCTIHLVLRLRGGMFHFTRWVADACKLQAWNIRHGT